MSNWIEIAALEGVSGRAAHEFNKIEISAA